MCDLVKSAILNRDPTLSGDELVDQIRNAANGAGHLCYVAHRDGPDCSHFCIGENGLTEGCKNCLSNASTCNLGSRDDFNTTSDKMSNQLQEALFNTPCCKHIREGNDCFSCLLRAGSDSRAIEACMNSGGMSSSMVILIVVIAVLVVGSVVYYIYRRSKQNAKTTKE
jgi:hypothetical protein